MRQKGNKNWTADELLDACTTARQFKYNKPIRNLIAKQLGRTPRSIEKAIARVRQGKSCFQINPDKIDRRFLTFINKDAVMKQRRLRQEEISFPRDEGKLVHEKVRKRGFSFSIGWGLIKITR